MPRLGDLLQPVEVLLLEDLADGETVEHAAVLLHAPAGLDGVLLRLGVEIALLVVPVCLFPCRKIAAHLHVKRDGNEGLVRLGVALPLVGGGGTEDIAHAAGNGAREEVTPCHASGAWRAERRKPPGAGDISLLTVHSLIIWPAGTESTPGHARRAP